MLHQTRIGRVGKNYPQLPRVTQTYPFVLISCLFFFLARSSSVVAATAYTSSSFLLRQDLCQPRACHHRSPGHAASAAPTTSRSPLLAAPCSPPAASAPPVVHERALSPARRQQARHAPPCELQPPWPTTDEFPCRPCPGNPVHTCPSRPRATPSQLPWPPVRPSAAALAPGESPRAHSRLWPSSASPSPST